jgi:pimeloyl-ACP methyl ester carboxylesterase
MAERTELAVALKRERLSGVAVFVAVLMVSTIMVSAPSADAETVVIDSRVEAPRRVSVPTLAWGECGDLPETRTGEPFTCATATVPLDHSDPTGPTIELALAKYPASTPTLRIGTLFINPGGPGGSGVDLAYSIGRFLDFGLGGRFDIVGFDPRGVARSSPLECFESTDALEQFAGTTPVFPYVGNQERSYFDHWTRLHSLCVERDIDVIGHMSTADVARDMDVLRRAVRDKTLTYLGFSYGSFLGQTYANMFPQRIRAIAIDGVLDPRLFARGRQSVLDKLGAQKVMDEFLRLCDDAAITNAAACPLSRGGGGAAARWNDLLSLAKAAPIVIGDLVLTYDVIVGVTLGVLYDPSGWSEFAAELELVLRIAQGGIGSVSAASRLRSGDGESPPYDNGSDSFFGNHCSDAQYPVLFDRWRRRGVEVSASSPFGSLWWWQGAACATWPVAADRYSGPWKPRTTSPILIVGNEFDPATPIEGARGASQLIDRDRLVTYEGYGHVAWGLSACATDLIHRYLRTARLPSKAASVCPAPPNPFISAESRTIDVRADLTEILVGSRPGR